ncbi:hypothetical protein BQ8482_290122 [Mesorhizobium delmotii]|uniref:Uncharacterized protein n=1 Tax=Mesorhizobium delmotii TaxID=1631247 RepID=A0A2P9AN01_9HYPH|nr:hypothetical protein BQ8482_290122 [Mesorhizobium delmotii]
MTPLPPQERYGSQGYGNQSGEANYDCHMPNILQIRYTYYV